MNENKKVAVYFDCENVSANWVEYVLKKLAEKGKKVIIAQAFKDWSKPSDWSQKLAEKHGIEPKQVFSNQGFKNGADIAITVSAMKELSKGIVQSIALVSSDSDFTHLLAEIRENGLETIVFGDSNKVNDRYRNMCDSFVAFPRKNVAIKEPIKKDKPPQKDINETRGILIDITKKVMQKANDNGFCKVAQIGHYLKEEKNLSLKENLGAYRWQDLFERYPETFECRHVGKSNSTLEVRLK